MSFKYREQKYDIKPEVDVPFNFLDLISNGDERKLLVLGLDVSVVSKDVYAIVYPVTEPELLSLSNKLCMTNLSIDEVENKVMEFVIGFNTHNSYIEPHDYRISSNKVDLSSGLKYVRNCSDIFGYKQSDGFIERIKELIINE